MPDIVRCRSRIADTVAVVNFRKEGEAEELVIDDDYSAIEEAILESPIHDTGSKWYSLLSFFIPPVGLITGFIFRHFKHIRNYKACRNGAIAGFGLWGAVLALFGLLLVLAVI